MTRKNIILLIILIIIVMLVVIVSFVDRPQLGVNDSTTNTDSTKTTDKSFLADFFSFSRKNNSGSQDSGTENQAVKDGFINLDQAGLYKISSMPIAGFGVFSKERFSYVPTVIPGNDGAVVAENPTTPPTEKVTLLRYVARDTGNVYQTYTDEISERKVTETIIPRLGEAFFTDSGDWALMRYAKKDNKTIATFLGKLPADVLGGDSSKNEITGSFMPDNILDVSVSPDSSLIFYIAKIGDNAVGYTLGGTGNQRVQIFDSAFTEWLSSWPNQNQITLTTKASGNAPGFMYVIDPTTTEFKKVLGNINGLTTLMSPDGNLVLYNNNQLSLFLYDTINKNITKLKTKTLAEKCAWTRDSSKIYCFVPQEIPTTLYPDAWYQGEVSFSDDIWGIDIKSGEELFIISPTSIGLEDKIDGIKPTIDTENHNLFFINKKDSYLWRLKLN